MRVPCTVPRLTQATYKASEVCLEDDGEKYRTLKAENLGWDHGIVPTLTSICIDHIVANFKENPLYTEITEEDQNLLSELLSIEVPLKLTAPLITQQIYWERCCRARWTSLPLWEYGNSWKRMYLERHLEELIEKFIPGETEPEEVTMTVHLSAPWVERLKLRELQPIAAYVPIDKNEVRSLEPQPCDHVHIGPVMKVLPHLKELSIVYGVRNCGMDFNWHLFQFTEKDCKSLAKGVEDCKTLMTLRIHRSGIDDPRTVWLIRGVINSTTLTTIDFMHNVIGNKGASAIAKYLVETESLTVLLLANNKIGPEGAKSLAYALTQNRSLLKLDLSLNYLGEEGGKDMACGLCENEMLQELKISACRLGKEASNLMAQMLTQNSTLLRIDFSNNPLVKEFSEWLTVALKENMTIQHIDLRMCGCDEDAEFNVVQSLHRNRELHFLQTKEASRDSLPIVPEFPISSLRSSEERSLASEVSETESGEQSF